MKNLLILFLLGIFTNSGFTQAAKSTDNENKLKNCAQCTAKDSKGNCTVYDFSSCQADVVKTKYKTYKDIAKTETNQIKLQRIIFKDYMKGILNNGWIVGGNYNGTLILVNAKMNATGTLKCGCCGVQSIVHDGTLWVTCATPNGDCKKCDDGLIVKSMGSLGLSKR